MDVVAEDVEFLTPKPQENEAAPKKKPALKPFDDDSDIPF